MTPVWIIVFLLAFKFWGWAGYWGLVICLIAPFLAKIVWLTFFEAHWDCLMLRLSKPPSPYSNREDPFVTEMLAPSRETYRRRLENCNGVEARRILRRRKEQAKRVTSPS